MSLIRAMNKHTTLTENGMPTPESSMDSHVDLFFKWGGCRGNFKQLLPIILHAAEENLDLTIRILFWGRDIRGGAGERQLFKDAIKLLINHDYINFGNVQKILNMMVEVGRWDDVLVFFDTKFEKNALYNIHMALTRKDGLCAKWMPREKNNPQIANKIREYLQLTPKQYRKMLVHLTNVVETPMCDNRWTDINYEKVPSLAAARYQSAFNRHDTDGYQAYRTALASGNAKINAAAVYPYNVVQSVFKGMPDVANAQWAALPNYLEGDVSNTLVVADTSGSMTVPAGNNPNVRCLDVCISLALYLSERNEGPFKDHFITFSSKPQLQRINGSLASRVNQLRRSKWETSTNLEAVFHLILDSAIQQRVRPEEMPSRIMILSDMQFNYCTKAPNLSAHEMIKAMYARAGYELPAIIFWNLRSSNGVPVEFDTTGTALVSGFSPSIMKSVINSDLEKLTPLGMMLSAVMVERYNWNK